MITIPIAPDDPARILEDFALPELYEARKLLADGDKRGTAKALRDLNNSLELLAITIEKLSGGQP